jgi:hypothetical protein
MCCSEPGLEYTCATHVETPDAPHVPTSVYLASLKENAKLRDRIKEIEGMLLDAWLAAQAGRPVEDCLVIKVRQTRVESWRHALGLASTGEQP